MMIAPITLLGGPLVLRAAWYTAGVVGGLSVVAATAPSDKVWIKYFYMYTYLNLFYLYNI